MRSRKLYCRLLTEFNKVVNDLNIGYELTECMVAPLWELIQLIECAKYSDIADTDIIKFIKKYEQAL